MVNVPERSRPSPESKKFDQDSFPAGTDILYLDDKTKKWKVGTVDSWDDPIKDVDGKLCGTIIDFDNSSQNLKLSVPPKKIDKLPSGTADFKINGKNYRLTEVDVLQDSGEVELTLVNTTNSKDRLENINLKTIKNLESVEKFEADIESKILELKNDIIAKADSRAKDILIGLTAIEKKVIDVSDKLGALSEWQEIGQEEAEQIGKEIKRLQAEVRVALAVLDSKLKGIEKRKVGKDTVADEAAGFQKRLDREVQRVSKKNAADHKTTVENAKTVHDAWKKDKAEWDKKKKAKEDWDKLADKKGKADPGDPGVEPKEPPKPESLNAPDLDQAKNDAAYALFESIKTGPAISSEHQEIITKVEELADKQAKQEGFTGFAGYDDETKKEVIAEIFQEVLEKEKKGVAEEGEKFDLEAEKNELKTKIKDIMTRAEAVGVLVVPGFTNKQEAEKWSKDVDNIPSNITEKQQEGLVLRHWDLIGQRELSIFQAEQTKPSKDEKAEVERDIDIPDSLLGELLSYKQAEVQAAIKELYNGLLNLGSEDNKNLKMLDAVKDIFGKQPPTQAIRNKLAENGIRNWDTFKKSWDKKLHIQVAEVLNKWAEGQLKNRAQGGIVNSLKNNGGSIVMNMGVGLALTYGGAQLGGLVADKFTQGMQSGPGKVAIGLASRVAGGSLAGVAKAGFHKLTGGFFARKQEATAKTNEEKAIEALIDQQFNAKRDKKGMLIPATGMADFSSILAKSLRDVSSAAIGGDEEDFTFEKAKNLKGDARRIYINHLKEMRLSGKEITDQVRLSLAISCQELMGDLEIQQEQFATPEHMGMITTLEEGQKYLGYKKGMVAGALVGAGVTAAFVGAAQLGANYVPILSGVLGAASGMTMGYRGIDKWHEGSKMKSGKKNFSTLFEETSSVFAQYNANKSAKVDVVKKGFFKDTRENKNANEVMMENLQRINRLLKGKADTESDLEMMMYLNSDPNLLARAKNLLYESHRSGLFAEQALVKLQEQAEKMKKEAETLEFSVAKKQAIRALGAIAGGVAFGITANFIGNWFATHRLESQAQDSLKTNAEYFDRVIKPQIIADAKIPVGAAVAAATEHATAHVEAPPVVPAAEVITYRPAGLIEAPVGAKTFHAWEQKMFTNMGYTKLPNGNIQHTFGYHPDQVDPTNKAIIPGTKFILTKPDGTPISVKGHVVEYKFEHGDSYKSAMEHLKHDVKIAIAAGETPTIKMEGHVEVGDGKGHFIIEHHAGGKTHMETGEAVKDMETPKVEAPTVRNVGPNEFKQGAWSQQHTDAKGHTFDDKHSTYFGRSGKSYTPIFSDDAIGDKNLFAFKDEHGNLFSSQTGEYFATAGGGHHATTQDIIPMASHIKTSWSTGGAISNRPALEAMLKGTTPGGPAAEAAPQAGGVRGGATTEVVKTFDAKVGEVVKPVDGKVTAPTAEAKVGAPVVPEAKADVAEVAPADMPVEFKGHSAEYKVIQDIKQNVVENLQKDEGFVLKDKGGEMNKLLNQVQDVLQKNPKLFNDSVISRALDSNIPKPTYERLAILVEQLHGKKMIELSDDQNILLDTKMSDNLESFSQKVDGKVFTITVAKEGGHAMSAINSNGERMVITSPRTIFDRSNVSRFLK